MPLDYLRKVQNADLPLEVFNTNEIDCLAVLKAAGYVKAAIPKPSKSVATYGQQGSAFLLAITDKGRNALATQSDGA